MYLFNEEVKLRRYKNISQLNYDDGSIYMGQTEGGIKQGIGMLQIPDGSIYLGEWSDDIYHGKGTYIYSDG